MSAATTQTTVTLFTDRSLFEQQWKQALSSAGLAGAPARPDQLPDHLERGAAVVIDAGASSYDEDELLAHVGLARALGACPIVSVPSDIDVGAIDDILDDLCAGLVARRPEDVGRIVAALARRTDAGRARRFEYLTVSPRGGELLAIFSDGNAVLVERDHIEEDDGTDIEEISLEDEATRAVLTLESGSTIELTAATVAGLTLHDMIKAVDPEGVLTDVRLLAKSGGKRGDWHREGEAAATSAEPESAERGTGVRPRTAAVIVASTRAAAGTRADETGPVIAQWLAEHGLAASEPLITPDADIGAALASALASSPALIIITGGTGVSPSDRTPEAVRAVLDTELPGIAEAVRERGRAATPTAVLSRAVAGIARGTVVVALPGSPGAVRDGLAVLEGSLDHLLAQLAGGGGHG